MKMTGLILKRLFAVLLTLILAAMFVVLAVMAEKPAADKQGAAFTVTEEEPLSPVTVADTDNAYALARVFDDRVPVWTGEKFAGAIRNAVYEGAVARTASLNYDGAVISCVKPVSAAALLTRSELSVMLRSDLSILSMPALYAVKDNARCLYFSSESAAYSIYVPDMDEDAFFALAARLTLIK